MTKFFTLDKLLQYVTDITRSVYKYFKIFFQNIHDAII